MADTIPDVVLSGNAYEDIYAATSIAVGTQILLQNKGVDEILIQLSASQPASQPASTSIDGVSLKSGEFYSVDAGESGIWCFGSGPLSVQEE